MAIIHKRYIDVFCNNAFTKVEVHYKIIVGYKRKKNSVCMYCNQQHKIVTQNVIQLVEVIYYGNRIVTNGGYFNKAEAILTKLEKPIRKFFCEKPDCKEKNVQAYEEFLS